MERSLAYALWFVLAVLLPAATPSRADEGDREKFIAGMIGGYAKGMPPNAPNLVEILAKRFPADLTPIFNKVESKQPLDAASTRTLIAGILDTILTRDAGRLATAPDLSLKAVFAAHSALIRSLSATPEACRNLLFPNLPTPALTLQSTQLAKLRLSQFFIAMADGRDTPVTPRRAATDADYLAYATKAKAAGFDVDSWRVLTAERIGGADSKQICHALESSAEATIAAEGELGEVIRVDQISGIVPTEVK